ncbi:molybdopterin molybdotransferase MoeA [Herbiconiux solani]|uniref:molybdopterin molybdotransferase MoeA n=1 Tax=Herbiconiux solani TaxID=661329 RepID=UPI001FDEC326|nr:gephyrin-like molybdotransferase Glp [Herbiconiux solani]
MRTIDDHRRDVTALLSDLPSQGEPETLEVVAAAIAADPARYARRVLAADLISPSSLPSFDNSQMDGYAVRADDLAEADPAHPVTLPTARRIAAGDPFATHLPGTATPIMTGAPVPAGADAVVQIERADPPVFFDDRVAESAAAAPVVGFTSPIAVGTFVRAAGSDVTAGQVLLTGGTVLGASQYGVIAGTGATSVEVRRQPRVLLVSTGHEIREPGSQLAPGQIFDSNSVALTVALQQIGCQVDPRPCRSDDADDLLALLLGHASHADVIVTVGGVSAGAREVVRDALEPRGVRFEKVAMQPGGPQGHGLADLDGMSRPVVSLPGNPVSALVSFEAFLRPALLAAQGAAAPDRELRRGIAGESFDSPPHHHQLRRGVVDADGVLSLVGGPSSHLLHSYAQSTALVHVPVGVSAVAAGDPLDYWRIDG